jgi:3-phenylpropionate/trans-cinnamate dioxygenase ferredoxin reductase component
VIATGTRARPLPVPGAGLAGVYVLRGIDDALALQGAIKPGKRLAVIGGGYVGLEAAATAKKLGADVTVIEAMPRLLARVATPELSAHMLGVHQAHGVDVKLSTAVSHLIGSGRTGVDAVAVQHGPAIPADIVLVGIGAIPNVEIAAAAGLTVNNGIVVDAFMRTSDPAIYAIGDCANHPSKFTGGRLRLESVQGAVDQAQTAAKALVGKDEPYTAVPWFWSDQYDERLQMAGVPAPDDATVIRRYPDAKQLTVWRMRGDRLTGVEAVNASKDYMAGRRLIDSGKPVEAARLEDPAVGAKQLLA